MGPREPAFHQAENAIGQVSILVNHAGTAVIHPALQQTLEEWDYVRSGYTTSVSSWRLFRVRWEFRYRYFFLAGAFM
jgi:hypothetical protein